MPVSIIEQTHWCPLGGEIGVGWNETGPQTNGQPLEKKMKRMEREAQEHTPASWHLLTKACPSTGPLGGGRRRVCVWVQKRLFVHVCLFLCLCETVSKCEWEHATWPGLITTSFQGPSKHERLPRYCLGWPAKNTGQSNTQIQWTHRAVFMQDLKGTSCLHPATTTTYCKKEISSLPQKCFMCAAC